MNRILANVFSFQIGWWSCVIGAARDWPWLGPIVVVPLLTYHLRTSASRRSEMLFLLVVALVGTTMDSLLALIGVVSYRGAGIWPLAPVWITALWVIFGTTLNVSMRWLEGRPGLAFVLGALAGPGTYYGAARLGAVEINGSWTDWVVLGVTWGLALPSLLWMAARQTSRQETYTSR